MACQKQESIKKFLRVRLDRRRSSLASISNDKNENTSAALKPTTSKSCSSLPTEGRSSEKSTGSKKVESPTSKIKKLIRINSKDLDEEKKAGIKRARSSEPSHDKSFSAFFGAGSENDSANLDDSDDFVESPNCSESQLDNIELKASGVQFDSKPCSKITLTLDVLLADKIQQDELDKMNEELQEHMLQGGITSMLAEFNEPDELLPEHREKIEQLKDFPQFKMNESPPWETVFKASHYCCLFSSSLYPSHFRFVPGKSKIDNTLAETKDVWTLDFLLKSDILRVVWCAVSNKPLILRWLFFIMSVHKEMAVSESCCKVILNAIQLQRSASRTRNTWAPEMADILRVFINYGASLEDLVPQRNLLKAEDLRCAEVPVNDKQKPSNPVNHSVNDTSQTTEKQEPDSNPDAPTPEPHYKISNLVNVLSVLAFAVESRPPYTHDQLTALFLMLCKIRMDIGIATRSMVYKIQAVLSRIIQKYTESEWPQKLMYLSSQLSMLISHHHNMLFLTETLPHCVRSIQLRRRLATLQLYVTVGLDVSEINKLPDLKISCLTDVFPFLKGYVQSELYKMYTAIDLLSIAVGDSSLNSSDREDLHRLMSHVTQLSEMLRDNGRMVACSTVKSKLVVLCTKWKILLESLSLTQKSLFAFTRQQSLMTPMTVEMTSQSYDSDSDSDTNSDHFSSSVSSVLSLPEI